MTRTYPKKKCPRCGRRVNIYITARSAALGEVRTHNCPHGTECIQGAGSCEKCEKGTGRKGGSRINPKDCEHEFERNPEYCTFDIWRGTCRKCGVWGWRGFATRRTWRPYRGNPRRPKAEWRGANPTARPVRRIGGNAAIVMNDSKYNGGWGGD